MSDLFTVNCARVKNKRKYSVKYPVNDFITNRIKQFPKEDREWNSASYSWELKAYTLFKLIESFKNTKGIFFDFGDIENKKLFIKIFESERLKILEKERQKEELEKNKLIWVQFKNELETTYKEHSVFAHSFLNKNIKLYPHQIIASLFLNKTRNALISHEMGLGKSLVSILFSEMNTFNKVVVITPNSLKFNYYYEVEKFTQSKAHVIGWKHNKYTIAESKYIILNYEFFNTGHKINMDNKWKKLNIGLINCVICDECFPYDTLIDTDHGKIKIGDIVENKLNVKISTYNHRLKTIETKSIARYLYNGYKNVIKVKLSNGNIIECTPEHKFYSVDENKYKSIELFKIGEQLYEYSEEEKNSNKNYKMFGMRNRIQAKKEQSILLFKNLFYKIYRKRKFKKTNENFTIERNFISIINKRVFDLWKRISNQRIHKKEILFNNVLCDMENETTRYSEKSSFKRNLSKNIEWLKESIYGEPTIIRKYFKKNDIKESYVQTGEHRKNEIKKNRKYFFIKRWKWSINKTTINIIFSNIRNYIYGNGITNTNTNTLTTNENKSSFATNSLQSGYRYSRNKTSNRSRWKFAQNEEMEIFRQKKNRNISIVRVESFEILESRDRSELGKSCNGYTKVYDLEINDNHNYFANNILVSNCHRLKNDTSNTYKNYKRIFDDKIFVNNEISKVYLSGTPTPNKAYELYTVLNQISPLDFPTKSYFYSYYCGMAYDTQGFGGWATDIDKQRFEELFYKIAPYTHRKRKFEVLTDLPDKIYQKVMLEMDSPEYKVYVDIEKGIANEFTLDEKTIGITKLIRLRQYTSTLKVPIVYDLINDILDTGEKIVVVDYFKDSLYELKRRFGDIACLHTGDQTVEERSEMVKEFQNPESKIKIFLGSIQTCNYGLTLTAASKLFILTLPYSVGEYDQVSDRLHRISQKDVVNIYPLIFRETIDEMVFFAIEGKRKEINKVMDNEEYISNVDESIISDIINKIKSKYK